MTRNTPRRQPRPSVSKESGLLQRTRRFLGDHFAGEVPHLLVGYSGGRDSLALLIIVRELERLGVCRLTAAHVDHGLRPDSAAAAAAAMRVAADLGASCIVKRAPGDLRTACPGQSVEDIARRFRYQQLGQVLEDVGADAIVVGHHRDDQVETVLLHILRGAGLTGLRGMLPDTALPVTRPDQPEGGPATTVRVVRPFLNESPETLQVLVAASGLTVIEDPTNLEHEFTRNRVRHTLLPLIEAIAPGAGGRIAALADLARSDDEALDEIAATVLNRAQVGEAVAWSTLQGEPTGIRRRVVRQWLLRVAKVDELSLDRVDAVIHLAARGEGGRRVEIGSGWAVGFSRGLLTVFVPEGDRSSRSLT